MEDLITLSECQEIVTSYSEKAADDHGASSSSKVISYQVKPFGDSVLGFLGEYFRLIVQIERNAEEEVTERSFFVKSLPRSNKDTRKMMERGGMFAKEVQIYAELFSKWPQTGDHLSPLFKWRPECYFTRGDVMVLEEIPSHYRHIAYKGNFEVCHCQEMMKALAKMHASSLNFERETGELLTDSYGHLMFEVALQDGNTWFLAGLELVYFVATQYGEYFRDIQLPEKQIFMERLHQVFKYRDDGNEFEKVLCHRDLWHSNMFFKYSEGVEEPTPQHCVMVDFQICSYHSPIFDLMISMFVSTRREFRDKELKNCFSFYFEYLVETLKESFKFSEDEVEKLRFLKQEECEKIRKYYYFYAMVINCMFTPLTQLRPGSLTKMQRDEPQRYFAICNINRNEFTRQNMDQDPFYKEYVIEAVRELVEYLCK